MKRGKTDSARVAAAQAILDRGWGKPAQVVAASVTHDCPPGLVKAIICRDPKILEEAKGSR